MEQRRSWLIVGSFENRDRAIQDHKIIFSDPKIQNSFCSFLLKIIVPLKSQVLQNKRTSITSEFNAAILFGVLGTMVPDQITRK